MFKLTSTKYGTYYCRSFADAERLKAVRKAHGETGYRIVELTPSTAEQRKQDHISAMGGDA